MSEHWDGLVLNDYEAVMPLTWKRKGGIHYLYQPFFTACLGVFGQQITPPLLEAFLNAVPKKFKYCDIYLNHHNVFHLSKFPLYQRVNYVLDLEEEYTVLYHRFRENTKRNIRKTSQLKCEVRTHIPVKEVILLAATQSAQFSPVGPNEYERFARLYEILHEQQQAITYGIYTEKGELVSSAAFFVAGRRAYYILVGNHPNGKTLGASHALINAFIRDHAGQPLLLDFEGSDLRNIAFFYSSFGAREEYYAGLKWNRLPWWLKWLKD